MGRVGGVGRLERESRDKKQQRNKCNNLIVSAFSFRWYWCVLNVPRFWGFCIWVGRDSTAAAASSCFTFPLPPFCLSYYRPTKPFHTHTYIAQHRRTS